MADTRPQPSAEPVGDLIERAKARAMTLRWHEPIPVRVFVRDGCVIWSKVDDNNCNLTVENSEGMLYHAHSLFVPHGAENPLLTARPQPSAEPVAIFQAARRAWLAGPTIVRDPETHSVRIGDKEAAAAVIASALEAAHREGWDAMRQAACDLVGLVMTEADINGRDEVSDDLYGIQCRLSVLEPSALQENTNG